MSLKRNLAKMQPGMKDQFKKNEIFRKLNETKALRPSF